MTGAAVFVGGRVYTGRSYAEALLVDDGRVVAVGDDTTVRRSAPTGAERVDLAGGLVVPGLADAHIHLGELSRAGEAVDAGSVRSVPELAERLRLRAEEYPGRPVAAMGFALDGLTEQRWPTRAELDRAVPGAPVVVYHVSGHAAAVNGVAAAEAGLPVGDGGPLVLREDELRPMRPVLERALPLTRDGLRTVVQRLSSFGLTAVGAMNVGDDELALLADLDRGGELPLKVRAYLPSRPPNVPAVRPDTAGTGSVRVAGAKTFLDGAFGPRTAALEAPYEDAPAVRGTDRGTDTDVAAWVTGCRSAGLVPAIHAIGDRAVERAAQLLSEPAGRAGSGRIEHASLTPPAVLASLARARPTVVVQPGFLLTDHWLSDRLGADRARWAYAFRSMADLGVPLAGSSDAPADEPDPWRGIRAAIERRDGLGRSANPWADQALPGTEALALYLDGAHRAIGLPDGGRLEPGAPADLVIVSASSVPDAIRQGASAVRETWQAGRRVAAAVPAGHGR